MRKIRTPLSHLVITLSLLATMNAACGSAPSSQTTPPTPVTTASEKPLPEGTIRTEVFKPTFSFSAGKGWRRGLDGEAFYSVLTLDSHGLNALSAWAEPPGFTVDGVVERIRNISEIFVGPLTEARISEHSGVKFDAVANSPTRSIYTSPDDKVEFGLEQGEKCRFFVVDVRGITVVFAAEAINEQEFRRVMPEADKILKTIRFS